MRRGFLPIALLLLCCAAATRTDDAPRIGVVRLSDVFDGYKQKDALVEVLRKTREAHQAQISELESRLEKLKQEIGLLEKGTTKHQEMERQALHVMQDLTYERQRGVEQLTRQKEEFHERILQEIRAALESYGAERGYTLILQQELTLSSEARSWRSVLYHAPETDITEDVLRSLNER